VNAAIDAMVADFVKRMEACCVERTNTRLRGLFAIGLIGAPERERKAMRAPAKAQKTARRKYTRSARWHAAQLAKRKGK
jgi:hypothetical protein